jgi:drug/metabolite transporter (DMT)-like permease
MNSQPTAAGHAKAPTNQMTAALWLQLVALSVLWGGAFFFAGVAVKELPPLLLVLMRVGIAAIALNLFLVLRGPSIRLALPFAAPFLALALLNNIIPFSLMFAGQTAIGAGLASVLNATTPVWTLILAGYVFRTETPAWNKLLGVVLGIAGVAVMIGPGLVAGLGGPVWAKFALIGTALSYAFAAIYARRFAALPPIIVAAGQLTASTIIMIPVALATAGVSALATATTPVWTAVILLALLSTAFAYIIYFNLIARAGSSNASLVTLLVPVSAIILSSVFLGERLELFEIAGMALIALGLVAIDGRILRFR